MQDITIYEQATSEQLRICLKIAQFFQRIDDLTQIDSPWACEGAIRAMVDILAVLNRSDVKAKLSKHLNKLSVQLEKHAYSPYSDQSQIASLLSHIKGYCRFLFGEKDRLCQTLRDDPLLVAANQYLLQPSGACSFDAPQFHQFLMQTHEARITVIENWLNQLQPIRAIVTVILHITRESTAFSAKTSLNGGFSQSLKSKSDCQLIRIKIANDLQIYPKISVSRHQLNVKFYHQNASTPYAQSIAFELSACE